MRPAGAARAAARSSHAIARVKEMVVLCRVSAFVTPPLTPVLRHQRPLTPLFRPPATTTATFASLPRRRPSSRSLACASSMEAPPEGYRRNVGICLANPFVDKIFTASRLDIPGAWQMPQGGIDEGEDPRNAAIRELREETGVTSAEIISEVPYWLTYDFPPEVKEKLNKQWGTNWNGQAQKWFLFKFTGKEEEINLSGDGTEKPEFGEWAWKTPLEVIEHAVTFKKPVYEEVLKAFAPYFQSDAAKEVS